MVKKTIPAGEFKQGCLALLDAVDREQLELVITKRGRPVARLVPMASPAEREAEVLTRLRGKGRTRCSERELMCPSSASERWQALE